MFTNEEIMENTGKRLARALYREAVLLGRDIDDPRLILEAAKRELDMILIDEKSITGM